MSFLYISTNYKKYETRKLITAFITYGIVVIISISHGYSQSINYLKYSVSEGLPSQESYQVFQDKKGFIWIATDNGIAKFDGEKLKTYHLKDGLSDPVVFSFHEGLNDKIWLRTYSGKICYIQNGKIHRFGDNPLLSNAIKDDIFYSLAEIDKQIWFSTGKMIGYIENNKVVIRDHIKMGTLACRIIGNQILLGGHGVSYMIKQIIINDKVFPIHLTDSLNHNKVYCAVKWNDKTYFSINKDIFEYSSDGLKRVYTSKALIISLSVDHAKHMWVGYHPGGVERFSSSQFQDGWFLPMLKDKSISKVAQDNEDGFWVSTLEEGLIYIPNLNILSFKYPNNSNIKIARSNTTNVFMSDGKTKLHIFDAAKHKLIKTEEFTNPIASLFVDTKNQLWVSTNQILILNKELKIKKAQLNQTVTEYAENKNFIWAIGSTRLSKLNHEGEMISSRIDSSILRTIHIDDSLIYLGIRSGIEIKNKQYKNLRVPKELADIKISKFLPLNDTTLFIASIGSGFFLLNKKDFSVRNYHADDQFIADNIYAVIKTDSKIWIGTENGIAIIDIVSLLNKQLNYEFLSKRSGLSNNKINQLVNTDSSVWVFTDDGYSIVPKTKTKFASKKPIFYLKEILVNDKSYLNKKLAHNENNLQIDFGLISFNNQNLFIRYRLSSDESWVYTRDRSLKFNSLAPGDYKLTIEYSVDNIHWQNAYTSSTLSISPPWWRTLYFQITILLIVLLIAFYITTQLRQRNKFLNIINEHQKKIIESELEAIDKDRTRIAKDLHDGIGTTLTSIKMGVHQVLTKYNQDEADEVENRLQEVLREVKNIIYDLTPPTLMHFGLHESLKDYIEKIASATNVQIKLDIFGEEIKQQKTNLFVFRIIQELVINSLKHSNAKNITIHLSAFDDLLNILYEDDGKGFEENEVTHGNGLYNIESRIQALQGKILFETSSKGVSYSIDIPLL